MATEAKYVKAKGFRHTLRRIQYKTQMFELRFLSPLIVKYFHRLYYHSFTPWYKRQYFGYPIAQSSLDMFLYQEIVYAEKPAFILQTGVFHGGSILYFAHLLDLLNASPEAVVIGIDLQLSEIAKTLSHPRIKLVEGDSVAPETIEKVKSLIPASTGLVSLDSAHECDHVLKELEIYSQFVAPGHHLVCEDTNVNGHPVLPQFGPGPYEAVKTFLARNPNWKQDNEFWQRNLFSFHQYGWLKRIS